MLENVLAACMTRSSAPDACPERYCACALAYSTNSSCVGPGRRARTGVAGCAQAASRAQAAAPRSVLPTRLWRQRVEQRLDVAVAIGEGDPEESRPSICGTWPGISM